MSPDWELTPSFVHTLPSLLTPESEPMRLPVEDEAEVDRRCAELHDARDEAALSGWDYMVGGS